MITSLGGQKTFAVAELCHKAQVGEPLWIGVAGSSEISHNMRDDIYWETYYNSHRPFNSLVNKTEASKESAILFLKLEELIEIFMNVQKWTEVFHGIVSNTLSCVDLCELGNTEGVLSDSLQLIRAQIHLPSPLISPRDSEFVRYCHKISDGAWCIVDFSLNWFSSHRLPYLRKRPSGCLIREMPNGYCKVTWVEHVEVAGEVVHDICKPLFSAGLAYGARRWLVALLHNCQRLPTAFSALNFGVSLEGRRSFLSLTSRLVKTFCSTFGASALGTSWQKLPPTPGEYIAYMVKKNNSDPGAPLGVILSASISIFVPVTLNMAFDYIRDVNSRPQWDALCWQGLVQQLASIPTGSEPGNCASIMSVGDGGPGSGNMMIVQESRIDSTGGYLVYVPMDVVAVNRVVQGQDSRTVVVLPSGFSLLPACRGAQNGGGCLLTVAFQFLIATSNIPASEASLELAEKLVVTTAQNVCNGMLSGL
uniref:START domain-containing protein n=1 Tax=Kalanchoe fedtschenkoi TaxID=63787 RepID=A0A7N0UR15_KALFE